MNLPSISTEPTPSDTSTLRVCSPSSVASKSSRLLERQLIQGPQRLLERQLIQGPQRLLERQLIQGPQLLSEPRFLERSPKYPEPQSS